MEPRNMTPKKGIGIYFLGARSMARTARIIATSTRGCNTVPEAPPPKTKLAGFSGSKIHPQSEYYQNKVSSSHLRIYRITERPGTARPSVELCFATLD